MVALANVPNRANTECSQKGSSFNMHHKCAKTWL